jgi:hypothetical protein
MVEIRKIDVWSTAKMFALLYGALGLIFGLIFGCFAAITLLAGSSIVDSADLGAAGIGTGVGLLYAVCFPFLYAVMGFIFGAIITVLYNLLASWTGGIQMDLVSLTGKEQM